MPYIVKINTKKLTITIEEPLVTVMSAKNFVNEILEYEDQVNHHGEVTIEHNKVLIEVFTQDLNCVTELDYEYAKMSDAIFHDVGHYNC